MVEPYEMSEPEIGPNGRVQMQLGSAFMEACITANRLGSSFGTSDAISVGEWPTHPDLITVKKWLQGRSADDAELEVLHWLSRHVRTEWDSLPKLTGTEHRNLFAHIEGLCDELDKALDSTGSFYYRGGGHGLMAASVKQLLTDAEMESFNKAMEASGGIANYEHAWAFPSVNELLQRVGLAAKRLKDAGPLHAQPNKRGAERGYFVRRMGALFQQRYNETPCEVLAAITSVSLGEPTDRELVAKLLK